MNSNFQKLRRAKGRPLRCCVRAQVKIGLGRAYLVHHFRIKRNCPWHREIHSKWVRPKWPSRSEFSPRQNAHRHPSSSSGNIWLKKALSSSGYNPCNISWSTASESKWEASSSSDKSIRERRTDASSLTSIHELIIELESQLESLLLITLGRWSR